MRLINKIKLIKNLFFILLLIVIQTCLIFGIVFSIEPLYTCGDEYLGAWVRVMSISLILILLIVIEISIFYKVLNVKSKLFKYSFYLLILIIMYPLSLTLYETFSYSNYYQDFDSEKWISSESKPFTMIRTLIGEEYLIGKSRNEIINNLGEGSVKNNVIEYQTDGYSTGFVVEFKKDTVIRLYFTCYD